MVGPSHSEFLEGIRELAIKNGVGPAGRADSASLPTVERCTSFAAEVAEGILDGSRQCGIERASAAISAISNQRVALIAGAQTHARHWSRVATKLGRESIIERIRRQDIEAFTSAVVDNYFDVVAAGSVVNGFTDHEVSHLSIWLRADDIRSTRKAHPSLSNDTLKHVMFRSPADPVAAVAAHRQVVRDLQTTYPEITADAATHLALRYKSDPDLAAKRFLRARAGILTDNPSVPSSAADYIALRRPNDAPAVARAALKTSADLRAVSPEAAPGAAFMTAYRSPRKARAAVRARRAAQSAD